MTKGGKWVAHTVAVRDPLQKSMGLGQGAPGDRGHLPSKLPPKKTREDVFPPNWASARKIETLNHWNGPVYYCQYATLAKLNTGAACHLSHT